jgi:hypothetical protein
LFIYELHKKQDAKFFNKSSFLTLHRSNPEYPVSTFGVSNPENPENPDSDKEIRLKKVETPKDPHQFLIIILT